MGAAQIRPASQASDRAALSTPARAQAALRRRDRRWRRPRPRGGVLSRARPRHHRRRGARSELPRRRQHGPQHHHHPRQLSDPGRRRLLQGGGRALARSVDRARHQPDVRRARPPDAGPYRCGPAHRALAGRGEQAPGRRFGARVPGRDPRDLPAAEPVRGRTLPDPRRALPSARRHRPPRRGRLGLRPRGRKTGRRAAPADRGDGPA